MEHQISFSDFLKEGALLEEHTSRDEEKQEVVKSVRIAATEPSNKAQSKAFWKKLRHFYRTGEIEEEAPKGLLPVLPAPYLRGADWITDYPFYTDGDHAAKTLHELLKTAIEENFDPKKEKIIHANIPRLVKLFRKHMATRHEAYPFAEIALNALAEFKELDVHGSAKELFISNVDKLKKLLPSSGTLLSFSAHTPIHIINLSLNRSEKARAEFIIKCEKAAIALEEKLATERSKSNLLEDGNDDFNNELVSFDKIAELQPNKGAELMSPERIERIKEEIVHLKSAQDVLLASRASIIVSSSISERLKSISSLENTHQLVVECDNLYNTASMAFDNMIADVINVFKAYRIAQLELDDKFIDEVHYEFFSHFNWHRLTANEWEYLPPVFIIANTWNFMEGELNELSKLFSSNKPIRVLAINEKMISAAKPDINWEDASHTFKQELASFSISHRSTHTYQGSLDQPLNLMRGMLKAFEAHAPSIVNVLVPKDDITRSDFIQITAAVEGRYTPLIEYNLAAGKWGSRFSINENPQPEKDWPSYPFKYVDANEQKVHTELPFTYADYKALNSVKCCELMHVPEAFVNESLVPIADFLKLNEQELTGKVPFIWMVDPDNVIHKMAMPYMWVVSCQERLDFWNYVQELCGVNSYHVEMALQKAKAEWNEQKELEIADLKSHFDKEIAKVKAEGADMAMEQLSNVLLGLNSAELKVSGTTNAPAAKPAKAEEKAEPKIDPAPKAAPKAAPAAPKKDAWIETFKCTSCNDCTENFPDIFSYNDDKQAIIKDASKASFIDLVEAAENCPANCIHPGAPKNPSEPGIEEYVERVKKFN